MQILPETFPGIIGWNVPRTSLEELPVTGTSVGVRTCLAESVSVICFKRSLIVSELSVVCFSPLLLKSPVESCSVGLECKTVHVQGAGVLKYPS